MLGLKPQPNTGGIIDRQGRLLGTQAEQAIAPLRTAPHTREVEAADSGVLDPNGYRVVLKLADGASLHNSLAKVLGLKTRNGSRKGKAGKKSF